MKYLSLCSLLATACLVLATLPARADALTVNSILIAQKSGAPVDGMIAMINDPANTVEMSAGDLVALRDAGVPEKVITALWTRVPAPPSTSVALAPDDARLVDFVRLVKSGISESIVVEQVRQDGRAYKLTVNDLLYLKQNGVVESAIGVLMATGAGTPAAPVVANVKVAPAEISFDDLVLKKTSLMKKNRPGRLVLRGDSLAWTDGNDPKQNFQFEVNGLEKVWFTCQARSPENFCYQINFEIVKGGHYRFQDFNRESGSNAAVLKVMDAMRTYFPELTYAPPEF